MLLETMKIIDTAYKDDSPHHTVERIKGILKTYGIETEEHWYASGVPGCYSLRVTVFGTVFGTNGKGVTKDLALASGYGELMERLQIGRVFKSDQQKGEGLYFDNYGDVHVPAKVLLTRNRQWYRLLAQRAEEMTGCAITEEKLIEQYTDDEGNIEVTSFYCVNKGTWEHLPTRLLNSVYTANGCAAGNTMEEAVVQAISEIVERQFSLHIIAEEIPVPDVPESVLEKYEVSYQIITYLRKHNFKVVVKDCSLGTNYPVVCVCLIDQKTGKYQTHFGAYPIFEIALQRTLTESFQGGNIEKVARYDDFFLSKGNSVHVGNLMNQLCKGVSEKKPEFFINSSHSYKMCGGFSGANNKELLKESIGFLRKQGHDILVRDCSCLGFPTYQVIVPGYSEVFAYRMIPEHNDMRYNSYAETVLRNPSTATIEQILGYMMNLHEIAKRQLGLRYFTMQANIPAQISKENEGYLMDATLAHLCYTLGRRAEAVKHIDKMISKCSGKHLEQLICLKRYLSLEADGYTSDKICAILEYFHQPETVRDLLKSIEENRNPLDQYVLHCDMKCQHSCVLYGYCMKKSTDALAKIICDKMREMDHSGLKKQFETALQ